MKLWGTYRKFVKTVEKEASTGHVETKQMELYPTFNKSNFQYLLESGLRASSGKALSRPFGSMKKWQDFEEILFIPAQTSPSPINSDQNVDISVTIGPKAKKPMKIDMPLIIGGLSYGIHVTEQVKVALAQASANVKTAINSGEGPFLPEEQKAAGKYILQYSKTTWAKERNELEKADMIEIKFGQAGFAAMGYEINQKDIEGRASELMKIKEGEKAVVHDNFFDNPTVQDFKELVEELRNVAGGVPVGAKILAGGKIEEELDFLLDIGVDYIAIDGVQVINHHAPAITHDNFGIPTLHGLIRTVRHLEKRGARETVSVICSSGLSSPGDYLKACAIGADAVYLDASIVYLLVQEQMFKSHPWKTPSELTSYNGKYKEKFDAEKGTVSVSNYLTSAAKEMQLGLRALGKSSLNELTIKDLVCSNEQTANQLHIPYTFVPFR
ncbi:FMN-binding glutamate synthase family protein [Bacillus solimangrovi]|nr:FMN-binding glutamate synthase family protein [Bacillus solimangrovi]